MKKYNFNKIEQYWQRVWKESGTYEPNLKKAKKPFYNLMMFPYPSAEGLHVGNMYAFTGADIYGRKKRMEGYDVFEPIGLDGFGIHSENYALKIGAHPMDQAKISEKRFYKQLEAIGNGFAWDERVETYDPNYYKWTQWVFTEMWRRGLAYRKKQFVNWCPSCKTVLADEQVIAGKCERCSSIVVKKDMEQWFFRITKYAEKLLGNLEKIDWSEKVKIAQRNWIGRSEGAELKFSILNSQFSIKVFTTRPDTLFGATYMVLAPEHPLISNFKFQISNYDDVEKYIKNAAHKSEMERIEEGREKTGVELKGIKAVNPANNEKIPVFVADYVLSSYGTGAIMAVPNHDSRDFDFAQKYGIPIRRVIIPRGSNFQFPISNFQINPNDQNSKTTELYEGEGILVNSGKFDGMDSKKAGWEITKLAGGERKIQYRLRDWLISRQRYWGAPIPMIYCGVCASKNEGEQKEMPGWYAVPEKDLPVKLPYVKDFRPQGKGESPLASVKKFYETKCPHCGGKARRETDVSDTFLDSAWYYLRYPSVKEKNKAWNPEITKKWFPVNLYTGGAEHSVLHLLYVRFVAMALHEAGKLHFEEPFPKFRAHGLLIKEGAKMSKSKGNVINPDEYIKNFGADSLRMYLMFLAPFEQGGDFRDEAVLGIVRFLDRVWNLCVKEIKKSNKASEETLRLTHRTIKKITNDIESLHYNTAISALMIFLNEFEKKGVDKENKEVFLKLLAPFAPHITEELWSELGKKTSIHKSSWPIANSKFLKEEDFDLVIQVNGKLRATIKMPRGASQRDAEKAAFGNENVNNSIAGQKPKKTIFVPNRLINFVI